MSTEKVNEITNEARPLTAASTTFTCRACGVEFEKPSTLYWHRRKEHSTVRHKCSICPKTFLQAGGLDTHMRVQHAGLRAFECPLCCAGFRESNDLYRHYRQHEAKQRADDEAAALAEKAAALLAQQEEQEEQRHQRHQQQVMIVGAQHEVGCDPSDDGEDEDQDQSESSDRGGGYECDACGQTFAELETLRQHAAAKHQPRQRQRRQNNEKKTKNKKQAAARPAKPNRRTSSASKKPYLCEQCNSGFASQSGLKRHQKQRGHQQQQPPDEIIVTNASPSQERGRKRQNNKRPAAAETSTKPRRSRARRQKNCADSLETTAVIDSIIQ